MALIYTPPTFEKVTYEIPDELISFVESYVAYVRDVHDLETTFDRVIEMMCETVMESSKKSMREFRTHIYNSKERENGKTTNKKLPKPDLKIGTPNDGTQKPESPSGVRASQ